MRQPKQQRKIPKPQPVRKRTQLTPKPKRKRRQPRSAMQRHTAHPMSLFSPFHSRGHVPTAHPHTEYVPIDSILNGSYTHTAGYEYMYLLSWTPTTYLMTTFYSKADQSVDPVGGNVWAGQQLGATASTQPLSIKPLRLGFRLHNITANLTKGGACYACPINAPLPITFAADSGANNYVNLSLANFNGLKSYLINNRNVQTINQKDLEKRTFVCVPNSEVDYERFFDFVEADVPTNADNVVWQTAYTAVQSATPLTQWLIYFPSMSTDQNYIYTVRRTDACKFPILSALQNTATRPPRLATEVHRNLTRTAGALVLHESGTHHETWGQRILHAGENAAGNIGTGIVNGAEWFARNALVRGGAKLARAIGWVGAEAAEAAPLAIAAL
jgi:hypothetical protein